MRLPFLCALGHVVTSRDLSARGASATQLRRAVADGEVTRVRRAIYACRHLDVETTAAARAGGALTCISALRQAGVWAGHDRRLHVQVAPTSSSADRSPVTRLHWERPRFAMESPWRVSRMQALWQAIRCLDGENAIAAMESAIHEGFLIISEVERVAAHAPRRLQEEIARMVPNSGSGNESVVRLRLQHVGFHVVSQPYVPGMGHGDLLVEDCVGLDVDGREWHGEDRFAIDRDRDIHVEGLGRHVLRLRASHIWETWPHTLAVIERTVVDARRDLKRRHGRVFIAFDAPVE